MVKQNSHSNPVSVVEVTAALMALADSNPTVLTEEAGKQLLGSSLAPLKRSLQAGVRAWVEAKNLPLGYIEQLYTFIDTNRFNQLSQPVLFVSYLGLIEHQAQCLDHQLSWQSWYQYFPWEDHRQGIPTCIKQQIVPSLLVWAKQTADRALVAKRLRRINICWGEENFNWNEEYVLQRYELLYEAKLIPEANNKNCPSLIYGQSMFNDHRRILASALTRLRGKIKYRPVIFELMPATFTLLQLQQGVEALAGLLLHKQNFRRMLNNANLVEATNSHLSNSRGRPAQLFRFKPNVLLEYSLALGRLPISK